MGFVNEHLVHKRTFNHLFKLAEYLLGELICVSKINMFDTNSVSCI